MILNIYIGFRSSKFWSNYSKSKSFEVCDSRDTFKNPCDLNISPTIFRGVNDLLPVVTLKLSDDTVDPSSTFHSGWLILAFAFLASFICCYRSSRTLRNETFKRITMQMKMPRERSLTHKTWRTVIPIIGILPFLIFPFLLWFRPFISPDATPIRQPSKRRLMVGRALATLLYTWGTLAYALWPTLFLRLVISFEKDLAYLDLPEQERLQNVGQWAPWIGVGVTVILAIVHRIRQKNSEADDIWTLHKTERPPKSRQPRWLLGWDEGWYWVVRLESKWKDFAAWWKDPMRVSWEIEEESLREEEEEGEEEEDVGLESIWNKILYPDCPGSH